jgi:hypothetical protein
MNNYVMFSGISCSPAEIKNLKSNLDSFSFDYQRIFEEEGLILNYPETFQDSKTIQKVLRELKNTQSVIILVDVKQKKIILYKGGPDVKTFREKIICRLSFLYEIVFGRGKLPIDGIVDIREETKPEMEASFFHQFCMN